MAWGRGNSKRCLQVWGNQRRNKRRNEGGKDRNRTEIEIRLVFLLLLCPSQRWGGGDQLGEERGRGRGSLWGRQMGRQEIGVPPVSTPNYPNCPSTQAFSVVKASRQNNGGEGQGRETSRQGKPLVGPPSHLGGRTPIGNAQVMPIGKKFQPHTLLGKRDIERF